MRSYVLQSNTLLWVGESRGEQVKAIFVNFRHKIDKISVDFPWTFDELPSDPRKNVSEGFCEARLLGKICEEIFGCLKVCALGHIFGGDHEIDCFSAL